MAQVGALVEKMVTSRSATLILVTVLFVTVGLSQRADAYIDLGTGSYLLQLLFAGIFALIFTLKGLWAKVRGAFGGSPDRDGQR